MTTSSWPGHAGEWLTPAHEKGAFLLGLEAGRSGSLSLVRALADSSGLKRSRPVSRSAASFVPFQWGVGSRQCRNSGRKALQSHGGFVGTRISELMSLCPWARRLQLSSVLAANARAPWSGSPAMRGPRRRTRFVG